MNAGNLFADIPASMPSELVQVLHAGQGVRIERIVSQGHTSPPEGQWYDQAGDEWVGLLTGQATILFDQPPREVRLAAGDWLLIPAHARHRVSYTTHAPACVWLAVHLSANA
jgi:cupin 2 domain-containing protein